jgi:hypothetical protein
MKENMANRKATDELVAALQSVGVAIGETYPSPRHTAGVICLIFCVVLTTLLATAVFGLTTLPSEVQEWNHGVMIFATGIPIAGFAAGWLLANKSK